MFRQKDGQDYNKKWKGEEEGTSYPTHYRFEKFEIRNVARSWWTNWDNKWYLNAFPSTEINKGYGLTQNPGW